MKKRLLFLLIFLLTSCTLYQKPMVPDIKKQTKFKESIKVTYSPLKSNWWENFNDPKLNALVNTALKNNNTYQITIKNIQIANTYISQSESALFPQVNLIFNSSRNKSMNVFNTNNFVSSANTSIANNNGNLNQSGNIFNLEQLFGSVTYELDVWNQVGNTVNQAKANVASSYGDSNVAKLTLISSVVNTYFQIAAQSDNLANLNQQYQAANAIVHLNKSQYRGELINITAVDDAKVQADNIQINIKNTQKQITILTNTLAYLVGKTPEDFHFYPTTLKRLAYTRLIPPGIPSKMLANRPDIQSAYYQVLSFGYVEKQNLANFLPTFNLTGNYGYANTSFSKFINPANTFWNFGLSLLQPVFDYKLRMSEYERSKYQYESAILTYKNTVINAFQEVDNALITYRRDHEALSAYDAATHSAKQKANAMHAQYQSGYGDYATYLSDRLAFLQNKYNLTNQQVALTQDVVQIYKTLGLGL